MPNNAFRQLPLTSLYELLAANIKTFLFALDTNLDHGIALKANRKMLETLLAEIELRKQQENKTVG